MPVFNKMVYNGTEYILGGGGNIGEPLNLTVTTSGPDATITWEDNEIGTIPPTTFQKSELVRKIGSAPTSPSDGVLVVTETVKDTYKTTGYVDQGLTIGETYYYRVFSYSDLGGISYCDAVSVTPTQGGLPAEYQEVEYIETTGTQWINTGLFPGNNIQCEASVEVSTTSQDNTLLGCYTPGSNLASSYYHLTPFNSTRFFGKNGSESSGGVYSPVIGTKYLVIYNNSNSSLNIDGNDVASVSGTTGFNPSTLGICMRGNPGGDHRYGPRILYYFKMYNKTTGQYERDFVPCYRKADGVIGMYDVVNDIFYTNSGTGTFIKGPDAN